MIWMVIIKKKLKRNTILGKLPRKKEISFRLSV
jgi:hypothetical protein